MTFFVIHYDISVSHSGGLRIHEPGSLVAASDPLIPECRINIHNPPANSLTEV